MVKQPEGGIKYTRFDWTCNSIFNLGADCIYFWGKGDCRFIHEYRKVACNNLYCTCDNFAIFVTVAHIAAGLKGKDGHKTVLCPCFFYISESGIKEFNCKLNFIQKFYITTRKHIDIII